MRICLVVGHSRKNKGAKNEKHDVNEFDFNNGIAAKIYDDLKAKSDLDVKIIFRDGRYSELPTKVNMYKPDFIVSLHCNAFNKRTQGSEVLYHHKSVRSKEIARLLQEQFVSIPIRDRGIKAKSSEDRGGLLLRETDAPCVIAEPFFIDSPAELEFIMERTDKLIDAYVNGIMASANYLEGLENA